MTGHDLVCSDGSFDLRNEPEDSGFSRQAGRLGVQLWATRKVRLTHVGIAHFPNCQDWGTQAYGLGVPGGRT